MNRLLLFLFLFAACPSLYGQTLADCEEGTLQMAVTNASAGATITIPNGDCTWTAKVTVPATAMTITGSGSTILRPTSTSSGDLFTIATESGKDLRITNLNIECDNADAAAPTAGIFYYSGTSDTVRLDHITFNNCRHPIVHLQGYVRGVADAISHTTPATGGGGAFLVQHPSWPCTTSSAVCNGTPPVAATLGHGSAASPLDLGSDDAWYIENGTYTYTGTATAPGISDSEDGARLVVRFNTLNNFKLVTHGTEGGLDRGTIRYEAYANDLVVTGSGNNNGVHIRSGNGVGWGNDVTKNPSSVTGQLNFAVVFTQYRTDNAAFPNDDYYKCAGISPYDNNNGAAGSEELGAVVASGTVTGGSANSKILTDTGQSWTNDQYQRYGVLNTTTGLQGFIYDNSATQIFILADHTPQSDSAPVWNNGNGYQIYGPIKCIDMTGWHGGKLMKVQNGQVVSASGLIAEYPGQENTPFYAFLNTQPTDVLTPWLPDRTNKCADPACPTQSVNVYVPNRDFYNQADSANPDCTAAFDGTCGVGVGTARPATCTTGVAYWETDEGTWNDGSNDNYTGDGQLYKCTATNTWTLYYTPLNYPHPLVSGSDPGLNLGGVSPSFGAQNATTGVTLSGIGFQGTDAGKSTSVTVTKSGGSGLSTSMTTVVSDLSITVNFVATAGATVGSWDVRVVTDEGTSNALSFDVVASGSPVLTTVSPNTCFRNSSCNVTFTGTGFTAGTITETCSGIAFNNASVVSDTVITALAVVDNNASLIACTVAITVGGNTSNTLDFQAVSSFGGPVGRLRAR